MSGGAGGGGGGGGSFSVAGTGAEPLQPQPQHHAVGVSHANGNAHANGNGKLVPVGAASSSQRPSRAGSVSTDHRGGPGGLRYVHLDVAGGSNNFGSSARGGSLSASGGKGGTLTARVKHIQALQLAHPCAANAKDPAHSGLRCGNCNPTNARNHFANNYISTTKYNLLSFLPLNLWEQFQKVANFYFLLVAVVSLTPLSPKTPIVSVAPLVLVLAVSAIKEALEDFARYKMDTKINASIVEAWRSAPRDQVDSTVPGGPQFPGTGFEAVAWADLQVGDVVFVREGQAFPADIILLQSSSEQGLAHIETANLDGETNLKAKQAIPECWRISVADPPVQAPGDGVVALRRQPSRRQLSEGGPVSYRGSNADEGLSSRSNPSSRSESAGLRWPMKLPPLVIESSAPSKKLDGAAWKANMTFLGPERDEDGRDVSPAEARPRSASGAGHGHGKRMPLGMSQLLLRGCILRNTKWVVGLVMFTGVETKLMLNQRAAAFKRSHVDHIVDKSLYILFGIEAFLCTFGAVANSIWLHDHDGKLFYLPSTSDIDTEAALSWFTYLVLLDILIPISLYVSMELVKALQAHWINRDINMYHAETNTPAQARTSSLNEELGQVHHVFSDKTGTLTCNVMNFVACAVEGKVYGMEGVKAAAAAAAAGGVVGAAVGAGLSSPASPAGARSASGSPIRAIGGVASGGSLKELVVSSVPSSPVGGLGAAAEPSPRNDIAIGIGSGSMHHPHLQHHDDLQLPFPRFKGLPPPDPHFPFQDSALVRTLLGGGGGGAGGHRGSISTAPGHSHGSDPSSTTATSSACTGVVAVDNFLTLLSVCHTVLPDFPGCLKEHVHTLDDNCKFAVSYQAASPDEKALVEAAKNQGYYFYHREPAQVRVGSMALNGEKVLVNILGHPTAFTLLDSFEFSSERARMSVIVQDPRDGNIKILTKGSDTKMYKLLSEDSRAGSKWGRTEDALRQFASHGLRTLICGMKVLSEEEYVRWATEYAKAKADVHHRETLVAAAQNEIEQGLTLVGATAIEDRLQDGVPDAITTLLAAGMKIWILTGDKVETAINIARSCSLVTPAMDARGLLELVVDDKLSDEEALKVTQEQLARCLQRVQEETAQLPPGQASEDLAIVVSGQALTHIFSVVRDAKGREILYENLSAAQRKEADVLREQFLAVASRCAAVVCCRVSPNQKAEVVSLVKAKQPGRVTLAIGDGANDCGMISAAHVGVGISGLEGLQAVMSSDYAIAQFRFLVPLLLVHGHWSYERISKLILYSFYKNAAIALTSIWFAFFSGFSAQLFYDAYAGSVYNIIFTSIPVMLVAVLDRDVSRENLVRFPSLYGDGLRNECFNVHRLLRIVLEGFLHSLVLYFGSFFLYTGAGDVMNSAGQTADLWVLSTSMYTYLIVVVTLRIALDTSTFTWVNYFFLIASVLVWYAFAIVYCAFNLTPDMFMVAQVMMATPGFWLGTLVVPAACIVPEVAWMLLRAVQWPTLKDAVMEMERGYGTGEAATNARAITHMQRKHRATSRSSVHPATPAHHAAVGGPGSVVVVRAPSTSAKATGNATASPRLGLLRPHALNSSASRLLNSPAGPTSSGLGSHRGDAGDAHVAEDILLPAAASRNSLFLNMPLNGTNGTAAGGSSSNVSSPVPSPLFSGVSNGSASPQPQPLSASVRSQRRVSVSQQKDVILPAANVPTVLLHPAPTSGSVNALPSHRDTVGGGSNGSGELLMHNSPPVSARRPSRLQGSPPSVGSPIMSSGGSGSFVMGPSDRRRTPSGAHPIMSTREPVSR